MTKIQYINKRFNSKARDLIEKANTIIEDYQSQGYTLTLRQLYYQFVTLNYIPNTIKDYKRLGQTINDARLAGLISWDAIEDRTRNLKSFTTFPNAKSAIERAARNFCLDLWADQDNYVEVWIEKEALLGVISGVCQRWRVPFFACKGYNSQSEQWAAGNRFREAIEAGKSVHVLHLGDHDPSGLDMTEDNKDRLRMFIGEGYFKVHRLALNMDQVKKYKPPPNPAKKTDSRFLKYARKHGRKCWELDALKPDMISALVERNIKRLLDHTQWERSLRREKKAENKIKALAKKA